LVADPDEPMASFGTYCARLAGIPTPIVERAIQVARYFHKQTPTLELQVHDASHRNENCLAIYERFVGHFQPADGITAMRAFLQWANSMLASDDALAAPSTVTEAGLQ
jgi:DNA mismatch repair ATPase MutS